MFEQSDLSYPEAMDGFIAAREASNAKPATPPSVEAQQATDQKAERKAERRALKRDVERLRTARRAERARRQAADEAWRVQREAHCQRRGALSAAEASKREAEAAKRAAEKVQWRAERSLHHQEMMRRRQADGLWREGRRQQREREAGVALVTAWIAVLVVLDSCTRQCLGLPLFVVGADVTAELAVEAPRGLLPKELRALLLEFRPYYDDRPHQGYELAGLSPNEYAARMALI